MITKNLPMLCVPRKMQRITGIFRIRIFHPFIFQTSGSRIRRHSFRNSVKKSSSVIKRNAGFPAYDAEILTESRHLADLFEETATLSGNPKKAANWFMGEVLRLVKEKGMEPEKVHFSAKHLADLLDMVEKNTG